MQHKRFTNLAVNFAIFSAVCWALCFVFPRCNKWAFDKNDIYKYTLPASLTVSDSAPLCGSVKGMMLSGKTYTVGCDININKGDTLLIQPGVTVLMNHNAGIIVHGTFICLGSKEHPNWFTVTGINKNDTPGLDPSLDPAYSGQWKGILGDTACNLMVIKWTHIDFGGAAYGNVVGPSVGQSSTNNYILLFQNFHGSFVLEDSWMYGATDDQVRISGGKISVMRNTFEKCGLTSGDCVNVKGGTVGDMAYNFFIGSAENAQKVTNKGQPIGAPQSNIRMYNNTFVNGGFRVTTTGSGANIDFEQGAKGLYYNNAFINCKIGPRVVGNPAADTAGLFYGYNYQYGDSLQVVNQFYPVGYISKPAPTDIPSPVYLPSNYTRGSVYDGTAVLQSDNPLFVKYTLPVPGGIKLRDISSVGSFNFRLQANSPLIGKGYLGFSPLKAVTTDLIYGATEISLPGKDLGCFQTNGSGNQH
ncbi:hypothetical protein ACX0G9_26235 [Flavitalea flava]